MFTEAPCGRFERAADVDSSDLCSATFKHLMSFVGWVPPCFVYPARCPHHFALVDAIGIQIINYEGETTGCEQLELPKFRILEKKISDSL